MVVNRVANRPWACCRGGGLAAARGHADTPSGGRSSHRDAHEADAYAGAVAVNRSRRAVAARRRKRRMDRVEHDLTEEQWTALKGAWGGCAYCGATDRPLQRDCVLALSRGGRYTLDNVAPACGPCNASKCNDEVTGWLRRKRYDERAFLERLLAVRTALAARIASAPSMDGVPPNATTPIPRL